MTTLAVIKCPGCGREIEAPDLPPEKWLEPTQWCNRCGGSASSSESRRAGNRGPS